MNSKLLSVAITATLVLATPVAALEKQATTPSGRAEMVFGYTALADAVTAVASECMDQGWMVASQANNQVVCEVPMGVWQSAFTQLLIGNSYSTTPKQFARFSLAQTGQHTRVQTQVWAETQMVFGQMQQQQFNDDGTYNNMLGFLGAAGAQLPVGTEFNSTAFLGVNGEAGSWQNGRRSAYGHRLTKVMEAAPGYRMGLREGDVLAKINGRTFRDDEGMTGLLNRQRVGQAMSLDVWRDGQLVTLSGVAEGRPAIAEIVDPRRVPEGETPMALQMAAALVGGVEPALAAYAESHPGVVVPAAVVVAEAEAPAAESELDRMRREAAEAQARLAAAEAAASKNE